MMTNCHAVALLPSVYCQIPIRFYSGGRLIIALNCGGVSNILKGRINVKWVKAVMLICDAVTTIAIKLMGSHPCQTQKQSSSSKNQYSDW